MRLRFYFHVVDQHSLECLSCKHKNTVFEYEFLITAITKAKARLHVNRYDGRFHEKLSGCSSHLQTDRLKKMQDCSWDPLNLSIQFYQIHHPNSICSLTSAEISIENIKFWAITTSASVKYSCTKVHNLDIFMDLIQLIKYKLNTNQLTLQTTPYVGY